MYQLPLSLLARQFQARSHDVVFLYSSGAAGLPFVPADEKDHINENRAEVSTMQGEDALQFSVRIVLAQTEMMLKTLPDIVAATGVDALVLDTVQPDVAARIAHKQTGVVTSLDKLTAWSPDAQERVPSAHTYIQDGLTFVN